MWSSIQVQCGQVANAIRERWVQNKNENKKKTLTNPKIIRRK